MSRCHKTPICEPSSTHKLELSRNSDTRQFQSQNFPITPVFLLPPRKKGFPWNWIPALEIKNANDGAIGPKRSLTITSTYVTDRWTDRRTNEHGTTAKTALTHSVLQLKSHQIVLMCCCTALIIHTYLLQCPVDSNSKL